MMTDTTYNGWSNKPTWLVNLHFGDDTEYLEHVVFHTIELTENADEAISELAVVLEEHLDEYIRDMGAEPENMFVADMYNHAMGLVDWDELAEAYYRGYLDTFC